MKLSDIEKLHELGLISAEQRQKIIETLGLKEESSRLLWILSALGAVLIVAGIILLISANWEAIPRGIKIAVGLAQDFRDTLHIRCSDCENETCLLYIEEIPKAVLPINEGVLVVNVLHVLEFIDTE